MIDKTVYPDGRDYTCDDCKKVTARFISIDVARKQGGWCVVRGRDDCYCPSCAPRHRHVGRGGAKNHKSQLPKGWAQPSLLELVDNI